MLFPRWDIRIFDGAVLILSFKSTPNAAPPSFKFRAPPSFRVKLPRLCTSSECNVGPYSEILVDEDSDNGASGSMRGNWPVSNFGSSILCGVNDRLWSTGMFLLSLDDDPQMRANNPPMRRDACFAFRFLSSDDPLVVEDNDCFPGDPLSIFNIGPPMDIDRMWARPGCDILVVSKLVVVDKLETVSALPRGILFVMETVSASEMRVDMFDTGRKLGVLCP